MPGARLAPVAGLTDLQELVAPPVGITLRESASSCRPQPLTLIGAVVTVDSLSRASGGRLRLGQGQRRPDGPASGGVVLHKGLGKVGPSNGFRGRPGPAPEGTDVRRTVDAGRSLMWPTQGGRSAGAGGAFLLPTPRRRSGYATGRLTPRQDPSREGSKSTVQAFASLRRNIRPRRIVLERLCSGRLPDGSGQRRREADCLQQPHHDFWFHHAHRLSRWSQQGICDTGQNQSERHAGMARRQDAQPSLTSNVTSSTWQVPTRRRAPAVSSQAVNCSAGRATPLKLVRTDTYP